MKASDLMVWLANVVASYGDLEVGIVNPVSRVGPLTNNELGVGVVGASKEAVETLNKPTHIFIYYG